MLDVETVDLELITVALQDQDTYERAYLINPESGEITFWTADAGIDGTNPVDLEELDLIVIHPLPSRVWYRDMADFVRGITDEATALRLSRAINGRGAFGRFKNELHQCYPHLLSPWHALHDARAQRRAVQWLLDNDLIDEPTAERFFAEHPDPELP